MGVAAKFLLIAALLTGQTPVCKVAAARSVTPSHAAAQQPPAPACKKACCAARPAPTPAAPARDHKPPPAPRCPTDCLSPLCSPAPVVSEPAAAVVCDAGASECLPATTPLSPDDDHPSRLDRPPRG